MLLLGLFLVFLGFMSNIANYEYRVIKNINKDPEDITPKYIKLEMLRKGMYLK